MPLSTLSTCVVRLRTRRFPFAPSSRRRSGFTLIEVLLVVAIVGVLAGIALVSHGKYRERALTMKAVEDIASIQVSISRYTLEFYKYPDTLAEMGLGNMKDPWGNHYQYLSHDTPKGGWRKDHNIVPINSDYDLWSNGKDGKSSAPLTAKLSRDDIVRANNGRFIGLASDYDP